jgi:hypothetical protein
MHTSSGSLISHTVTRTKEERRMLQVSGHDSVTDCMQVDSLWDLLETSLKHYQKFAADYQRRVKAQHARRRPAKISPLDLMVNNACRHVLALDCVMHHITTSDSTHACLISREGCSSPWAQLMNYQLQVMWMRWLVMSFSECRA